jgi:hypothetical protein
MLAPNGISHYIVYKAELGQPLVMISSAHRALLQVLMSQLAKQRPGLCDKLLLLQAIPIENTNTTSHVSPAGFNKRYGVVTLCHASTPHSQLRYLYLTTSMTYLHCVRLRGSRGMMEESRLS